LEILICPYSNYPIRRSWWRYRSFDATYWV